MIFGGRAWLIWHRASQKLPALSALVGSKSGAVYFATLDSEEMGFACSVVVWWWKLLVCSLGHRFPHVRRSQSGRSGRRHAPTANQRLQQTLDEVSALVAEVEMQRAALQRRREQSTAASSSADVGVPVEEPAQHGTEAPGSDSSKPHEQPEQKKRKSRKRKGRKATAQLVAGPGKPGKSSSSRSAEPVLLKSKQQAKKDRLKKYAGLRAQQKQQAKDVEPPQRDAPSLPPSPVAQQSVPVKKEDEDETPSMDASPLPARAPSEQPAPKRRFFWSKEFRRIGKTLLLNHAERRLMQANDPLLLLQQQQQQRQQEPSDEQQQVPMQTEAEQSGVSNAEPAV